MSERMSDEEIVRAFASVRGISGIQSIDDALAMIERLTAERDAAMAWFRAVEKVGSALCLTFDLTTPAEKALRDVLRTACSLAEFEAIRTLPPSPHRDAALTREAEAFRAGAEAMRRDAATECDRIAESLDPQGKRTNQIDRHVADVLRRRGVAIRALPLPAHSQSGTENGRRG